MFDIETLSESFSCGIAIWFEFAGDPLVSGTVFMLAYFITAVIILICARWNWGRERTLWTVCGLLFLFQVLNVHGDLHGLVYAVGKCTAKAQGWYQDRHRIQTIVLLCAAFIGLLILLFVVIYFFRNILGNLLLVLGVLIALGLTFAKGVNHHDLDAIYGGTYGYFRGTDLIELLGISIAFLAAMIRLIRGRNYIYK